MKSFSDFVIGKKYQVHHGVREYICLFSDQRGALVRHFTSSGSTHDCVVSEPENWEEIPPPKKTGSFWVNIYPLSACGVIHTTHEIADGNAGEGRLACVEIKWTEGDGIA